MTENEFFESVKDRILDYLPEEYAGSNVRLEEVTKNNDTSLHGLTIVKIGDYASPVVYLDGYYADHQNGRDMDDICNDVAKTFRLYLAKGIGLEKLDLRYDAVRDNLRVKLVNNKANKENLKRLIHQPVPCGFSMVPYIDVPTNIMPEAMIQVTRDMAANFGYDPEQLIADAVTNTQAECAPGLYRIEDMLFGNADAHENLLKSSDTDISGLLVLTNDEETYGAVSLYLPDVQEQISEAVGGSYFVLPSSVHELLILPDNGDHNARELAMMVKAVNSEMVAPEEKLGDRVLRYDADSARLGIAADLERVGKGVEC